MPSAKPVWTEGESVSSTKLNQGIDYGDEQAALSKLFAHVSSSGLNFSHAAGRVRNGATVTAVNAGTIALTASQTNYIEVDHTGAVSKNTSGFSLDKRPLFVAVCDGSGITSVTDRRVGFVFIRSGQTYTQTYSTAGRTVNAYTSDAESADYTSTPAALGDAATLTDLNQLRAAYETLRASHDNLLQVVTALIDDLQTAGIVG